MYYIESVDTDDSGVRPSTGWTVPCSILAQGPTGLCSPTSNPAVKWSQSFNFSMWSEYTADLRGALPNPTLLPGPGTCKPLSTDPTIYNDVSVLYRSSPKNQSALFAGCSFQVSGAGSPEINGLYVRDGDADYVARYRIKGTNVYLFRWGSTNQRITFPDATGDPLPCGV